jgi:hypothetical protein
MSNKQQTAVEWFNEEINKLNVGTDARVFIAKLFQQAKEMEKDKMENLWDEAISHGGCNCYYEIMTFEQYYKETFNK